MILAAILGLAAATAVAAYVGFGAVLGALERLGWRGLVVLVLCTAAPFTLLGLAWRLLAGRGASAPGWVFIWGRMVRDSAGELLPFSHLAGFVSGARAAIERGADATVAPASMVVDLTTELIAQLGFIGLGVTILVARLGGHSDHANLLWAAIGGLALLAAGGAGFIALQRRGRRFIEALAARFLPEAAARTSQVLTTIEGIYQQPLRVTAAIAVHLLSWVSSATGVWIALRVCGMEVHYTSVLAIESLVATVRTAAFFAPMGIGVQEASYAVLGPLFGVGPELALAISLLKRARDLTIGVPTLLAWQGMEGVRLATRKGA